ncbi:MAG: peptidylprolyl isomerase [Sphingobacteriaceae bacterium]|nr:peptidylprolyl isomerase [Sphingobacteriaceae bacterium]
MGKEKNPQQVEKKKENISVLEMIRKRTGLLVGIVGLALVIFILESLLSSGPSIFGGDDMMSVGKMNGVKIDRNDFAYRIEQQMNQIRQQRQNNDIDDQTRAQIVEFVWNQYINDLVIKPEFAKLGISVSEDEIYDRVVANPGQSIAQRLIDQKTGKIYEQLANANGDLDPLKWKQFVQNASGDQEGFIKDLEEGIRNSRQLEKYSALIRKGIYVTDAEAKEAIKVASTKFDVNYVMKRYDAVSDSAYQVADSDIEKYYKENSHEFRSYEASRKIEYVAFNVMPSPEDLIAIEKNAQEIASNFKGKTLAEDSAIMMSESENGNVSFKNLTKETMIIRDTTIYTDPVGTVYGPYNEGAYFKIYKLVGKSVIADSARVRHILIGTVDMATQQVKRTPEQAKKQADSLLTLIKEKKAVFDTLVKTVSDDGGSIDKGGDYGWFGEDKGFVEPFKNAGLLGKKGDISVVETQFGYHIIEVLEVSPTKHESFKVAEIFKLISPSEETNDKIFATANEFGGKNNTAALFDKAVEEQKLTKRVADNIKEGDRQLPGIEQAKELVKWVYTANKGDVQIFSLTDKHIVAKLSNIVSKGILPLEDVKDEITDKARQKKKAEAFAAEFKSAGANDLNALASKLNIDVRKSEQIPASSHGFDGFHDDVMMGVLSAMKQGQTSKVVEGEVGVFVVQLSNLIAGDNKVEPKFKRMEMEQEIGGRSDYEVMVVLKEMAEIEDHKSRLD